MGSMGIGQWLVVLLVVLIFFGGNRIKSLGRDLGGAIRDFREGLKENPSSDSSKPSKE